MRDRHSPYLVPMLALLALVACDEPQPIDPEPQPIFGAISAVVTHDGDPVSNAGVRVTGIGSAQGYSRRTAANGWTRVDSLMPGLYSVWVSAPSGFRGSGTDTVLIEAGSDITLSFTLEEDPFVEPPRATIVVYVLVDSVSPYEGAVVRLISYTAEQSPIPRSAPSDAQGRVEFMDLIAGGYDLEIDMPDGYEADGWHETWVDARGGETSADTFLIRLVGTDD